MNRTLADSQELEKAPAAVAVKIIRKATGKVQKGRAINVNYGMRSRKMIAPRRQAAKKEIAVGEGRKTVKRHISRVLMEGCEEKKAKGGAIDTTYYDLYRATWKRVEEEIDAVLDDLVKPVCDRTLEVAQSMDQSSSIPQLVPVIFHDAAGLSSLDYTKYFRSTVLQFRRQGYTVIQFLSEDIALFRKMGVWAALYTLATEQNRDVGSSSAAAAGTQVNSAVAKRLLEELYQAKKTRIIITAENIENLDKGILGEILFALSEVWDSIPAILLMGQFVKKEYIYSVIPKNVLTKMYPTSVSIPSGYEMVEQIVQNVLLGSALSSNLLLGPAALRVVCEFLLDYQCSTHILKRFLKSMYLYHVLRTPLHTLCVKGPKAKTKASAGMMRKLKLAMKLKVAEKEEDVWRTYQEEEAKLRTSFRNFGTRIRILDIAARAVFNRKDVYLKLLKAGASALNPEKRFEQIWREGSLFHGLKKGILKSNKQCLLGLIKRWNAFVEEESKQSSDNGGEKNRDLSELSEKLSSLLDFEAEPVVAPTPQKKVARPVVSREGLAPAPARGSRGRRQALQSHISSLADGSDQMGASSSAANRLAPFQRACADFLISICEVPHEQNPCTQLLASTLVIEGSRSAVDMIFPSIPNNMVSSIKDPNQFLKYSEGKEDSLQSMEDAAVVFHFVQGFSSSVAMEDIFGQFNDVISGKTSTGKKRKRGGIKTSSKKTTESKEASNLRFERAIQELNLCGLIKINKRKMNKFVSSIFD